MTLLRVWAPNAGAVDVIVDRHRAGGDTDRHPMAAVDGGWWEWAVDAEAGDDYGFSLDGGDPLPDPRSRWQPHGVDGLSRLVDDATFRWTDTAWHGRTVGGAVIYELHIGTFAPEGTFEAATDHLDHLCDLGVDFISVMPVNAFPGDRGWGYDGVGLYAVQDAYGGPDGLKRFVDACHARGVGVLLDVVYNHLGPSGNHLPRFGPYFTDRHMTPWGQAVNLDGPGSAEVRRFIIDNALQWIVDYHCDGLRLDAVHALVDESPVHLLAELHDEVQAVASAVGRTAVLIAESDLNEPVIVLPREDGGFGMDAQWSDDFHHALHAALTGEQDGYYADFGGLGPVADALTHGYVYRGQASAYRGRPHGRPLPGSVNGHQLLGYLQTHDQVGNRARGERTSALLSTGLLEIGAALVLTSAFTPMLFMGEEWGASTPWCYFTSHTDRELAEAVRKGRREEFAAFGWDPELVPDPQDPGTFEASRLDWDETHTGQHAELLDWHKALVRLRGEHVDLVDGRFDAVTVTYDDAARWIVVRRGSLAVACNLGARRQTVPLPAAATSVLLASGPGHAHDSSSVTLEPESVAIVGLADS